jgi:hypothetical protein
MYTRNRRERRVGVTVRHPRLPGTARASATTAHYARDDTSARGRRPDARELERRAVALRSLRDPILCLLAVRPYTKWELHEQLHVADALVYRALQQLRDAGQVKVIGRRLAQRRWALRTYQPPAAWPRGQAPTHADAMTVIVAPRPRPTSSWWTSPAFRHAGGADG